MTTEEKLNLAQLLEQLGPYNYPKVQDDGVQRKIEKYTYEDEEGVYEGQWNVATNMRDGKGKHISRRGSVYEGYWKDDQANGKGRLVHSNLDIYEGDWENDMQKGYGTYKYADGAFYKGFWEDDQQHG